MIKKISAILLALVLCLSVMVVPASAYELADGMKIAYEIVLDKEYYNAGDTVTVSLYMYGDATTEFTTGSVVIGCNSAVFDQAENAAADVKASATTGDTVGTFYKPFDGQTWAWQTNATVYANIQSANTDEENSLYDQYIKVAFARQSTSDGTYENSSNTKRGFYGADFTADSENGSPALSFQLKLKDDIADGTVVNVGITKGTMPKNYTVMNYLKTPGTATTALKTAQTDSDVIWATSTIGIPAAHTCTPAEAVQENVVAATCGTDGSYEAVVYCATETCKKELSRETVVVPATGEHVYAKEIERVEPTCTTDGYVVNACGCSDDVNEKTTLPATGHTYKSTKTNPTCTEVGYTTYTCSVCNDTYTGDEVAAKGHNYKSKVTAPTCTEAGYTTYTCPACKDTYTADETVALGHSYESVVTAPTCTEVGYTTDTCSACGDVQTKDEVAATGHSYEVTFERVPSCSAEGFTQYTCSACSDNYRDPIPSKNHTNADGTSALVELPAVAPTCKTPGKTAGKQCTLCNAVVEAQVKIDTIDHTWDAGVVTEPTYTAQGYTTYTCTVCGEIEKRDITDKKVGVTVEIETPASTEVAEGQTVTLNAPLGDSAEGYTVQWTANNANFTLTQNDDGSVTLTPVANGKTEITVTVFDEDGVEVSKDTIEMTAVVESDDSDDEEPWWKKLINWIINLFKTLIQIIVEFVTSLIG